VPVTQYEFRVSGQLSERAQCALAHWAKTRIVAAPPETLIYVDVRDEADLRGVLGLTADLGLCLVSLNRMPES
jgi:hypothetical protein